jgi:hypothetical protein
VMWCGAVRCGVVAAVEAVGGVRTEYWSGYKYWLRRKKNCRRYRNEAATSVHDIF